MKTFKVSSLPLKNVIMDLAKGFNTDYFENCQQYYLEIPSDIGYGIIKGINFESGLGILQYDCTFLEDIKIEFVVNKTHPLKFLFCAEGVIHHTFQDEETVHKINTYQNAIVASSYHHGHVLKFQANTRTVVQSLEIARKDFAKKIDCLLGSMSVELQDLFKDINALNVFYYDGFYSISISEMFDAMNEFEQQDFLKKLFLEGKSYEILTQQILQYEDDLKDDGNKTILRKSQIFLIENAAQLIRQDIAELDGIKDIANKVGLNKRQLQDGFKNVYNLTVNNFIKKTRLEIARELLIETDLSISEIVYKVGISSKSYLSKIFKESYNMSPKDFRIKNTPPKK